VQAVIAASATEAPAAGGEPARGRGQGGR